MVLKYYHSWWLNIYNLYKIFIYLFNIELSLHFVILDVKNCMWLHFMYVCKSSSRSHNLFSIWNPLRVLVLISSFTPHLSAGLLCRSLSFIRSSLISMTAGCSFTHIHTSRWVHSEVPVSTHSHRHTVFFRSDSAMNPERPTPCYGSDFKNSLSYSLSYYGHSNCAEAVMYYSRSYWCRSKTRRWV